MSSTEVELLEWDPENMLVPQGTMAVVGGTESGKSVFIRYLLYLLRNKLDLAVVFCPTRETRMEYEKHIPKCFVTGDIEDMVDRMQALINTQHDISVTKDGKNLRNVALLTDDCTFSKKNFNSKTVRYLAMDGRHDNFFFINAVQYIVDIPSAVRDQVTLAVVFKTPNAKAVTMLRESLLGTFPSDDALRTTFNGLEKYEALVFDKRAFMRNEPHLFYFKAPPPDEIPHFRVGNDLFWRMYYRHRCREHVANVAMRIHTKVQSARGIVPKLREPPPANVVRKVPRKKKNAAESEDVEALPAPRSKRRPRDDRTTMAEAFPPLPDIMGGVDA